MREIQSSSINEWAKLVTSPLEEGENKDSPLLSICMAAINNPTNTQCSQPYIDLYTSLERIKLDQAILNPILQKVADDFVKVDEKYTGGHIDIMIDLVQLGADIGIINRSPVIIRTLQNIENNANNKEDGGANAKQRLEGYFSKLIGFTSIDINFRDQAGESALGVAVRTGNVAAVRMLLNMGAGVSDVSVPHTELVLPQTKGQVSGNDSTAYNRLNNAGYIVKSSSHQNSSTSPAYNKWLQYSKIQKILINIEQIQLNGC